MATPGFTAAVLAGGQSRRLGVDKAFVEVKARWLISRVLDATSEASQRLVIGGTDTRLRAAAAAANARCIPDRWPGEGPLGAVVVALRQAHYPITVILPCDLPGIAPADVAALVEAVEAARPGLGQAACAVFADDRRHNLPLAISTDAADLAEGLFEAGQRSAASLLDQAAVVEVPAPPLAVADIDTPDDLQATR